MEIRNLTDHCYHDYGVFIGDRLAYSNSYEKCVKWVKRHEGKKCNTQDI
jgi:hypothetical protein